MPLTVRDLRTLRAVLRHVSTSNVDIQSEVLRLDTLLADIINTNTERNTNGTQHTKPAA